jgi:hypothetical protein
MRERHPTLDLHSESALAAPAGRNFFSYYCGFCYCCCYSYVNSQPFPDGASQCVAAPYPLPQRAASDSSRRAQTRLPHLQDMHLTAATTESESARHPTSKVRRVTSPHPLPQRAASDSGEPEPSFHTTLTTHPSCSCRMCILLLLLRYPSQLV